MTRALYRGLLWLHPPTFRDQFGDEMQLIFDDETAACGRSWPLLGDCFLSALRQWIVGYKVWKLAIGMGYWFAFLVLIVGMLAQRGFK